MFSAVLLVLVLFNGASESIKETPMETPQACGAAVAHLMESAAVTDNSRKLVAACILVPVMEVTR